MTLHQIEVQVAQGKSLTAACKEVKVSLFIKLALIRGSPNFLILPCPALKFLFISVHY